MHYLNVRLYLLALFLIVLCASFSAASDLPERVILTWTGDPAHTQAVSWRSEKRLKHPQAMIAAMSANPEFGKTAKSVAATPKEAIDSNGRKRHHYTVDFTDLMPGTFYSYRVGGNKGWSEWHQFRTADAEPARFRFLYFGDAQNEIRSLCSRTFRQAYATAPDVRFSVFAGDLLEEGYDDALWGEWCDAMSFISATVPTLPVPGNHDMHRAPNSKDPKTVSHVSGLWPLHFALPQNGPEGIAETCDEAYFIDYQGVRLISIDANPYANNDYQADIKQKVADGQLSWLDKTLKDNPNRWTIVIHHQPLYSVGKDRDNAELREKLRPLYDKYHVDLVLQGHDHYYGRTQKLVNDKMVANNAQGTVYVVSVAGAKMYSKNPKSEPLMEKMQGETQMFQVIDVDGGRLSMKAYGVDGTVVDEFELKK